jgi:purine nucleosidase
MDLSKVSAQAADPSAIDLLATTLRQGGVTLLTLGPLTNVAESFRADPALAGQVTSIVVMGGALDVPGNVSGEGIEPSTAEWNMYVDPTAAAEVVASGAPIVLVGLDATSQLPITGDFLELSRANTHT